MDNLPGKPSLPRRNIHQLILELEDPDVRLEDNTLYRVNEPILGILYAGFVARSKGGPGITSIKMPSLALQVLEDFQKSFQIETRKFLSERLGDLICRQKTAENFYSYAPTSFPTFAKNSLEFYVTTIASKGDYELLGKGLKKGAKEYHQLSTEKKMFNYRFAAEYTAIKEALKP